MRREGRARSTCLGRVWGSEADIRCLPLLFSVYLFCYIIRRMGWGYCAHHGMRVELENQLESVLSFYMWILGLNSVLQP